ncbi:MAG: LVIVD repeat-containing protein [Actinomycetota bacterium]
MSDFDGLALRTAAHNDLAGCGDGMQIVRHRDALYVGHHGPSGMGTSVLDISDPVKPKVVRQIPAAPGSHSHKVQVGDGLLLVNEEQFQGGAPWAAGMIVYDLTDPFDPKPVGRFDSGGLGVHRIVYTGGSYAFVSAIPDGFDDRIWVIVDLSDPTKPVEAGRWWWPGMWRGGGEAPDWPDTKRYAAHHALLDGEVAYLGYGDAGMVVLDASDVSQPTVISKLQWSPGGDTHTCLPLPGRSLVITTDEAVRNDCEGEQKLVRVIDVSDVSAPEVVAICPPPDESFCKRGLRFGPHNLHENLPGSYRSETLLFVTYFNAGLRVYDLSEARAPREVAYWVPDSPAGQKAPQINDLYVDASGLIYVTDRITGGLYVLEPDDDLLGRMEATRL